MVLMFTFLVSSPTGGQIFAENHRLLQCSFACPIALMRAVILIDHSRFISVHLGMARQFSHVWFRFIVVFNEEKKEALVVSSC